MLQATSGVDPLRSWTLDLKNRKIRVNAISPGVIETAMSAELSEQVKTNLMSTVPLGRMGRPDEIAKAVAFLASDDIQNKIEGKMRSGTLTLIKM